MKAEQVEFGTSEQEVKTGIKPENLPCIYTYSGRNMFVIAYDSERKKYKYLTNRHDGINSFDAGSMVGKRGAIADEGTFFKFTQS